MSLMHGHALGKGPVQGNGLHFQSNIVVVEALDLQPAM